MGMILDGHLYYGKSGFSGEIGHFPLLDNNIMCRCGKIGCLETGASGSALHRIIIDKLKAGRRSSLSRIYKERGNLELSEILKAVSDGDVLAIECIGEIGDTLGRGISGISFRFQRPYIRLVAAYRSGISFLQSIPRFHCET